MSMASIDFICDQKKDGDSKRNFHCSPYDIHLKVIV